MDYLGADCFLFQPQHSLPDKTLNCPKASAIASASAAWEVRDFDFSKIIKYYLPITFISATNTSDGLGTTHNLGEMGVRQVELGFSSIFAKV